MRTKGVDKIRETLGAYVGLLKTGIISKRLPPVFYYNLIEIRPTFYQSKHLDCTSHLTNEDKMLKLQSHWNITCNCALKKKKSQYPYFAPAVLW